MLRFVLRRVASLVLVVVAVTAATWLVVHLLRPNKFPDDPRPLLVQLGDYLRRVFFPLDFGRSWSDGGGPGGGLPPGGGPPRPGVVARGAGGGGGGGGVGGAGGAAPRR